MLSLIAINIVSSNNRILNKNGVPIVLYTEEPETAIKSLSDGESSIGSAMRTFIINNIVRPLYGGNVEGDLYAGTKIIYIYYNGETAYNRQGSIDVQDIFQLDINSSDVDTSYLSLYYIRKALNETSKSVKLQLMRKYDFDKIMNKEGLDDIFCKIQSKYSSDILSEFKKSLKDRLFSYGLSTSNVNNLIA